MYKYKIKSYTIVEIAIVLLLSTICILTAFESYSIIQKSLNEFLTKIWESNTIIRFEKTFQNDIDNSLFLIDSNERVLCIKNNDTIIYSLNNNILREYKNTDSFEINIIEKNISHFSNSNKIIVEIQLRYSYHNTTSQLLFTKEYPNDIIMNYFEKDKNQK